MAPADVHGPLYREYPESFLRLNAMLTLGMRTRRGGRPPIPKGDQQTLALQEALLDHGPGPAMILVILALIGASGTVRIRRSSLECFDKPMRCPEVQAVFAKYRRRFAGCLEPGGTGGPTLRLRYWDPVCQAKAFEALCAMDRCEIHELFTAVVASTLAGAPDCRHSVENPPLAAALARELGADAA